MATNSRANSPATELGYAEQSTITFRLKCPECGCWRTTSTEQSEVFLAYAERGYEEICFDCHVDPWAFSVNEESSSESEIYPDFKFDDPEGPIPF